MKAVARVMSIAVIFLALSLTGCLGASSRPVENFVPTGPTEDGVPAPLRINIMAMSSGCEYTIKVGAAPEVVLNGGEHVVAEVWPGQISWKYKQRGTNWLSPDCVDSPTWKSKIINVPYGKSWQEGFATPYGAINDPYAALHETLAASRRVAAFSIQQTTPAQVFHNRPYYGPWPHASFLETGRVYLSNGVFTGKVRTDGLVHGQLRLNDGGIYMGEFQGVAYSGNGTLISAKGEVFSGTFVNGVADGEGVCSKPGGAPEYCYRKNGSAVPPPSLDSVAREQLAQLDKREREQLTQRANADIGASETHIANLQRDAQSAPQRVRAEKQRMVKECRCFLETVCLDIHDRDETPAQREAFERAKVRQARACNAWQASGGNRSDEELLRSELDRIAGDLRNETAALARKKQQAEAQRQALIRKQEAEREQRYARLRAQAEANRKKMLEERERECQKILQQPFNCGCNAYLPKSSPVPKLPGGGACPA